MFDSDDVALGCIPYGLFDSSVGNCQNGLAIATTPQVVPVFSRMPGLTVIAPLEETIASDTKSLGGTTPYRIIKTVRDQPPGNRLFKGRVNISVLTGDHIEVWKKTSR